jgi:hypothetical protein
MVILIIGLWIACGFAGFLFALSEIRSDVALAATRPHARTVWLAVIIIAIFCVALGPVMLAVGLIKSFLQIGQE